jgi:DNA-directed RNA polymerase subunit K/omega
MSKRVFKVKKPLIKDDEDELKKMEDEEVLKMLEDAEELGEGEGVKVVDEEEGEGDEEEEGEGEGEGEDEEEEEDEDEEEEEDEDEEEEEGEEDEMSITPIIDKNITRKSLQQTKQKVADILSSKKYDKPRKSNVKSKAKNAVVKSYIDDEAEEGSETEDGEDEDEDEEDDEEDEDEDDEDEDDEEDETRFQKFNTIDKKTHLIQFHPDILQSNYDEIMALTKVVRDEMGNVIDPLHKTISILTKYEKTRVLGLRAKQINQGADPFISVADDILEGYVIAEMELEKKAIPFIIVRPLPGGKKEYWKLQDLEVVDF